MRKIALLLLSSALVVGGFILPAAPAHAALTGAATCDVTLDTWPTTTVSVNSSGCVGMVLGMHCGVNILPIPPGPGLDCPIPPLTCIVHTSPPSVGCSFDASVDHYQETCVGGLPPPLGTADGRLTVDGQAAGTYNWLRVGLTAILVPLGPGSTAGVAAFVPHPPIPTCAAPGQLTATVVGFAASP